MNYRALLESLGMTHQQLADHVGAHRNQVTRWVGGRFEPPARYLLAILRLVIERLGPDAAIAAIRNTGNPAAAKRHEPKRAKASTATRARNARNAK